MNNYSYKTKGTCSREIQFTIDGGKVKNVKFVMGCQGNTRGISSLVEGMDVNDAINRLSGIDCGGRGTSCPDQLARALRAAQKEENL